jgi:hypothetical protein
MSHRTSLARSIALAALALAILPTIGAAHDTNDVPSAEGVLTYYLAEGATGAFFSEDLLIANPNTKEAPVTLTFFLETGTTVVVHRTVAPQSRATIHVNDIPGLESTAASVAVTSDNALPLAVELTMFWPPTDLYAGHTVSAVAAPAKQWRFAEGTASSDVYTYLLVMNPTETAGNVTLSCQRDDGLTFITTLPIDASSRRTISLHDYEQLFGSPFSIDIVATLPVVVERSEYFTTSPPVHVWNGGHSSAGATVPATKWFFAEGVTGDFFDTFIVLDNPNQQIANVTVTYLLGDGTTIAVPKTIMGQGRLTIAVDNEADPRLHAALFSAIVSSNMPIVAERTMYWPSPWNEAHNSLGLTGVGTTWGLAEGRVGGPREFYTYILIVNPETTAADVTITYLRESGAPIVKQWVVPPTSRTTIVVNSDVPELRDESFGAYVQVTNGVNIAVERSLYWNALNNFWSGGTNATAVRLP